MSDKAQITTLLKETDNARAWFEKLSKDLAADPSNETVSRLLVLTKGFYEKRVQLLADMGITANDQRSRAASASLARSDNSAHEIADRSE